MERRVPLLALRGLLHVSGEVSYWSGNALPARAPSSSRRLPHYRFVIIFDFTPQDGVPVL